MKGTKIPIRRYQFGRMFELSLYGVSYTYDGQINFPNLKLSTTILSFVMNPMKEKKRPLKASFLKAKICVEHYLLT